MAKRKQIGICKLCLKNAELRESHIASKFFWRRSKIIGAKQKFHVECENFPEKSLENQQDGFKEHLLCGDCEQHIGKWETYFSKTFYGKCLFEPLGDTKFARVTGFDYKKFKLLMLSLLWRIAVSKHIWCAQVKISEAHKEKLRCMILNETPGKYWEYGVLVSILQLRGESVEGLMLQPRKIHFDGELCFRCVIAGLGIWFFVNDTMPPLKLSQLFIRSNNTWLVLRDEAKSFGFMRSEIEKLGKGDK